MIELLAQSFVERRAYPPHMILSTMSNSRYNSWLLLAALSTALAAAQSYEPPPKSPCLRPIPIRQAGYTNTGNINVTWTMPNWTSTSGYTCHLEYCLTQSSPTATTCFRAALGSTPCLRPSRCKTGTRSSDRTAWCTAGQRRRALRSQPPKRNRTLHNAT
jgi:hypothetical protein